jgi:hypothetical protein
MNANAFNHSIREKEGLLRKYVVLTFPGRAGNMTLRFINGNFRAQGWQGATFQAWRPIKRKGTILVKQGTLRRGTYFTTQPGRARIINPVVYARVHNEGFRGTVTVQSYQRRNFKAGKVETGRILRSGRKETRTVHTVKSVSTVKSHTRKMNIPRRQFTPTTGNDSPVLVNALRREVERELRGIFSF